MAEQRLLLEWLKLMFTFRDDTGQQEVVWEASEAR